MDVNALFANRKKKGKKKKTLNNFNLALEEEEQSEQVTEPVPLYEVEDEDGNSILVPEPMPVPAPRKPGSLTAAVNAKKKAANNSSSTKEKESVLAVDGALVTGEWVDEPEDKGNSGGTLLGQGAKVVADLENLPSGRNDSSKDLDEIAKEEENKKLFHWTRKQALQEQELAKKGAKKEEEEVSEKPKVYRPRQWLEAKKAEAGVHALKELDNEQVFPSLGGKVVNTISKNSAWGTVKAEVLETFEVKQSEGEYLDSDFIASETFQGQKIGYSFKLGLLGLGYYWECKPVNVLNGGDDDVEEEEGVDNDEQEVDEEPKQVQKEQEDDSKQDEQEETTEKTQQDIEKERKRREKKKQKELEKLEWEKQVALALEKEKQREAEAAAAENAPPAPVPAAVNPLTEDRFAGLKKKKKKKKKVEE